MTNPYAPPHASAPPPFQPPPPPPGYGYAQPGPRLHAPNGVALATFLGTPLAGAILIADNERRLGRSSEAVVTLLAGVLVTAITMGIAFVLPAGVGTPLPFITLFAMRQAAMWRLKSMPYVVPAQPLSNWIAAGAGMASLVVVLVVVMAGATLVTLVHPDKVAFPPADEVYFEDGATEKDARAIGEVLSSSHFFGDKEGKMVTVTKIADGLAVSFIVKDGAWDSEKDVHTFEKFGRSLSEDAFHDPKRIVEVRLCNTWTVTKKTVSLR